MVILVFAVAQHPAQSRHILGRLLRAIPSTILVQNRGDSLETMKYLGRQVEFPLTHLANLICNLNSRWLRRLSELFTQCAVAQNQIEHIRYVSVS